MWTWRGLVTYFTVFAIDLASRRVHMLGSTPNANAHAERFVRSIKKECLNRLVPLGDRHFRLVIAEYLEHYHRERNHQRLDNELIAGAAAMRTIGPVCRRARLGGLLNYYARAA